MALQRQIVSAPFAGGEDTKTDPLQVPGSKVLVLQNGFFQSVKELRKRFGYVALPKGVTGGGTIGSGQALGKLGNELVMGDDSNLYSMTPATSTWRNAGPFIPAKLTTQTVNTSTDMTPRNLDGIYDPASGLKCFIWQDGTANVFYSIVDGATGEVAASGIVVSAAIGIVTNKVAVLGGFFLIFYSVALTTDLFYMKISTTTLAITGPISVGPDVDGNAPNFDIQVFNNRLYFTYNSTGGGSGITTAYMDASLTVIAFIRDHTHPASAAITLWNGSPNCWVAWSNNGGVYFIAYNADLSGTVLAFQAVSAQVNVNQITGVFAGAASRIFYCARADSTADTDFIWSRLVGAVDTEAVFQRDASLFSKAFIYAGNIHLMAYTIGDDAGLPASGVSQATYFLLWYQPGGAVITGKVAPGLAPRSNPEKSMLAESSLLAAGVFQIPYGTQVPQQWATTGSPPTVGKTYFFYGATLDLTVTPQSAEIANSLHLTGAQLWLYDGLTTSEHGFHLTPAITGVSPTAGASPFANATHYIYIATYSWSDAQGQTHTSGPSAPSDYLTAATASKLTVTVKTLRLTNKVGVRINIYRTAPSKTGGTLWYAVGSVANNKAVDSVSIDDDATDTDIIGGPQLYTNSGEVANGSAPACLSVATYKSRLIVIPSDNPYSWWFSKPVLPASGATVATAAEFSPVFVQNIDQKGGPLTGVIAMDDKIVFGKSTVNEGSLFYVVGDGPAITGASNDFSTPQIITSPVGVASATSMVLIPAGVMFQAQNAAGIWMVDRSLAVSYIGAAVESNNGLTVLWASLVPEYNQVRFLMSNGTAVVYDYFVSQWMTYTNHSGLAAVIFKGAYSYLKADGAVFQEANLFTDNGVNIARTVVTAWLDLSALNGFQRVRRLQLLGTYFSAHSITISVAYDYDGTILQSDTITVSAAGLYEFLVHLARQKCEAVQITITDASGAGEGARWSGLTFEVGAKVGLHKLPPTAAYG